MRQNGMRGYDLPVYAYSPSEEQRTGTRIRHPVAVVGAGLTGLTAACDLALRGIPAVVLDDDDTVGVRGLSSRGICYARRSLEIFDRLGIYPRIAEKGVTWTVGRVLSGDAALYSFDLQPEEGQKHPPFINLQQYYVEWFLVERFLELGVGALRWKNRVVDVRNGADHVELDVETPDGLYTVEAAYVLACDGANSVVRRKLGAAMSGETGDDRWCISDAVLSTEFPTERWTWIEAPFNENRGVWQHLMGDDVWRLDFQMAPDADPDEIVRPEVVERRLREMLGPDVDFELVWVGPYFYRNHVLDRFRHGRVFFLGDAAHLMSPFGARGGNSGIQDADNIGWKLALVLDARAPETLLDSYDTERRAAALHNVRTTARSARFMAPRGSAERAFRRAVLDLAKTFPFARAIVNAGRLSDAFDYSGSPLVRSGGTAAPNAPVIAPDGAPRFLLDTLGSRFVLLLFGEIDAPDAARLPLDVFAVRRTLADTPYPLLVDEYGLAFARYDIQASAAVLIRPDGHIAARLDANQVGNLAAVFATAGGGAV